MLKIFNLKEKPKYIEEISILTQKEWGEKTLSQKDFNLKVKKKISKIKSNLNNYNYCKLILLDDNTLIGFISIFPNDGNERQDLSPWYATMYVKEEYRGKGYSKILNAAIITEARKRNFKKLYLKSNLENYYEKFGAKYIETLKNEEKLYYIDIPTNRISIIGGSGSGKSTLATILSKELNIPAIHLDAINYNANWVEIDQNERELIIQRKSNEDKWIIDGNYNKTLKERLDKSDLIIWLDYSSLAHLKGILKRLIKYSNKEKPELPGCKERFNFAFLKYVISYNRKKRPEVLKIIKSIPSEKVIIFRKQKDLNRWLEKFTQNDDIISKYI